MLKQGINPDVRDENNMTPMMWCCRDDSHGPLGERASRGEAALIAEALLDSRAEVDAKGPGGWTALF